MANATARASPSEVQACSTALAAPCDPGSTHQGETREERLAQFLEENLGPVLGMREGTWLRRDGDRLTLDGAHAGARFFVRGQDPLEIPAPADLSPLLAPTAA